MEIGPRLSLCLLHYPIKNRLGEKVSTNITNFDIHDIARVCTVYDIQNYYLVHPLEDQRNFVGQVLEHWRDGKGAKYNPMRASSLGGVYTACDLSSAVESWKAHLEEQGEKDINIECVFTSARPPEGAEILSFQSLREELGGQGNSGTSYKMLVFGTGFGLHSESYKDYSQFLEPIQGVGRQDYRHLSVRSAVTICLDRLLGSW